MSLEKIAKLNLSWRRAARGTMLAVMAGCGAFLSMLMTSKEPDGVLVRVVGVTGCVSGAASFISEIITAN